MKTLITALLIVIALSANAQHALDTLAIASAQWRTALAHVVVFGDTLKCNTTKTILYRSGKYRDRIVYVSKNRVYDFSEAEILLWCARKEDQQ